MKSRGIPLFSLHGTHSVSTAEHALALLFAVARRIPWAHARMTGSDWRRWEFIGTEISGKTLGIFGIGRIGTEVAKRARALGLRVLAYDPYVSGVEAARRGARKTTWRKFIAQCDFLSLHSPLTLETKHAFGKKEFGAMKPSAIFINTARGEIVEEKALVNALKNGRIRAAALDVYPEEPLPKNHALRRYARAHSNLILTPHIGASTREAAENASMFCADALVKFFGKR